VQVNRQLRAAVREEGARRERVRLYEGIIPGLYLPAQDIWLAAHSLPNRFRNAFGPGDPRGQQGLSPSIQLNLAFDPGESSPRARFMRDSTGRIWLAHTGTLGGRQPGISREGFVAFCGGARSCVLDGTTIDLLLVGTFADPKPLVAAIAKLVHAAHAYRSSLAAGLTIGQG